MASTETTLELDIGIISRAKKATRGKVPILIECYERTIAVKRMFKTEQFAILVPVLVKFLEASSYKSTLEQKNEAGWKIADVPTLSKDDLTKTESLNWFYLCMLNATVICINNNKLIPTSLWRADLVEFGVITENIDQFLKVLEGSSPNKSLYQDSAATLFMMQDRALSPQELWRASFRLLNVFMNFTNWVESPLEKILVSRWIFATNNQRFAFSTPQLSCPEIQRYCSDQSLKPFPKIAVIISFSAPYLKMNLPLDAKNMISKIIKKMHDD